MVDKAFKLMDKDGSGTLTVEDLTGRFNAKEHPLVKDGKITEHEVFSQMLESFNAGGDGRVTTVEWNEYYSELSSGIDNDD